jgi:hypothetical protein
VRARGMGCRQYTPSSNATTLESKKSESDKQVTNGVVGSISKRIVDIASETWRFIHR